MTPRELLDLVTIASPCPASWDAMTGDDRARFCATCSKHVYNFAAMTADEAAALIIKKEGQLCGRLFRRKDGTILTADCPVGLKRKRSRRVRKLAVGGLLAAALTNGAALIAGRVSWSRVWDRVPPVPSGPGVTLGEWSDWALVSLGLRKYSRYQVLAGVICVPTPPGGWPAVEGELAIGVEPTLEDIPSPADLFTSGQVVEGEGRVVQDLVEDRR